MQNVGLGLIVISAVNVNSKQGNLCTCSNGVIRVIVSHYLYINNTNVYETQDNVRKRAAPRRTQPNASGVNATEDTIQNVDALSPRDSRLAVRSDLLSKVGGALPP